MWHRQRAGFTFVEIVIAVLILTATVLVFAGVMTATSGQSRAGGAATQAPLLASHILETIKGEIKAGTLPDCATTTATHQRSELTYNETRTVRALALDEATGTLDSVPCDAVVVNAYEIDVEVAWQADGIDHSDSYSETVSLAEHTLPRIDRFEANTTLVLTPQDANANRVTLSWDVPVGGQPLDVRLTSSSGHDVTDLPHRGDATVNVTRSTAFTLTATNPAGSHTLELIVYAIDLALDAFTGAPPIVGPNEPVALTWATDIAPDPRFLTLRLKPLDIDVTSSDRYEFPAGIDATTTYSLEVFTNHESGMLIDSLDATVEYSATPIVHSLTRAPDVQCAPGGNVTIAWDVSAGHRVDLDPGTGVPTLLYEGGSGSGSASVAPAPPGTHTWTVIFTNRVGTTTTQSFTVASTPLPVVTQSLTPNPAVAGVEVMHAWNVDNATGVTLNDGAVARTGSNAFRAIPGVTGTSYAIAAQNDGCTPIPNPRTSTLTIEPIALTNVTLSTAHPSPAPGEDATLSWAYTNTLHGSYHRVRVLDQNGTVHYSGGATSATFALPSAGTFTFTVRLETTEATPRLLHSFTLPALTVRELPVINGFTLPASVCAPSAITASWSTTHAHSATIDGATVTPVASGSRSYAAPHANNPRPLTLVASNAGGRTAQQSGSVAIQQPPTINSFTISNATPAAGETITLAWNVSHASSATLDGVAVSANGSATRQVLDSTPFVLTAEPIGPCASATRATQTIMPSTRVPSIGSFAGTSPILVGQSSTLTATLANFDAAHQTATILAPVDKSYTTSSISEVVTPESSTTYTLRVATINGGHPLATANATVTVYVPTISVLTLASGYSNPALNGEPHGLRYELEHFDNTLHEFTLSGPDGSTSTSPTAATGTWAVPNSDTVSSAQTYVAEIRRRSNGALLAERSYSIDVAAAPTTTFGRTPDTTTTNGTNVTLEWAHDANWSSTYHRSTLWLNGAWGDELPASGTHVVAPTTTTNYYLYVWRRSDNTILRTYSFRHTTMAPPTVSSLTASTTLLCGTNQSVTVYWNSSSASSVLLYNSYDGSTVSVAASGSRTVTARSGGFVRLTASNDVGSDDRTVSFSLSALPSVSLSISPTTADTGESFTLSWSSTNASTRSLTSVSGPATSGSAGRSQSSVGTYTYTFTGSNSSGCSASVSRSVTVTLPPVLNMRRQSFPAYAYLSPATMASSYFDNVGTLATDVDSYFYLTTSVPQWKSSLNLDYRLQSVGTRTVNMSGGTNADAEVTGTLNLPRGSERSVLLKSLPARIGCRLKSGGYTSSYDRTVNTYLYFLYDGTRVRVRVVGEAWSWNGVNCEDGSPWRFHYWRGRYYAR